MTERDIYSLDICTHLMSTLHEVKFLPTPKIINGQGPMEGGRDSSF